MRVPVSPTLTLSVFSIAAFAAACTGEIGGPGITLRLASQGASNDDSGVAFTGGGLTGTGGDDSGIVTSDDASASDPTSSDPTPNPSTLPHTVTACPTAASAGGNVGAWENITPPYITAHASYTGALVVLVNPQNPAVVYVTSDSDGVFKTTNCGSTWTKTNTGMNGAQIDTGRIWSAALDAVTPDTLYAVVGYGASGLWKTTNGGVDWHQTFPAGSDIATTAMGFVERVSIDPTSHQHIVVNFHQNCSAPHPAVCFGESIDGGATWKIIDVPKTVGTAWSEGSGVVILQPKVWLYATEFDGLFRTADGGATWANVSAPNAGGAVLAGAAGFFQAPGGTYYLPSLEGVLTSADGAKWSLIPGSGAGIYAVMGDGQRLFAGGFDGSTQLVYAAQYTSPLAWAKLSTPGLPAAPSQALYTFGYDPDHSLLYSTLQSKGVWRVATK